MRRTNSQRTSGYSITETVIAIAILGFVVACLGQFAVYVNGGMDDLRLSKQIRWDIENARELIDSWPYDRVTKENIQQMTISPQLAQRLEGARWTASVVATSIAFSKANPESSSADESTSPPPPAKSVTLKIQAQYRGQAIQPAELTFWVFDSDSNSRVDEVDAQRENAP